MNPHHRQKRKSRRRCHRNSVPNRFSSRFLTSPTNGPRSLSQTKMGTHTRLSEKDRTQRLTRRNRERFRWGALSPPSERSTRFENPAWPGLKTANFAAFGSWSETLPKNAESLGTAMRLCASLSRGVAAPLGCVIFFASAEVAACTPCAQCFPNVRDEGWYHYPRRALRVPETPDGRLSKRLICRFLRLGSLH